MNTGVSRGKEKVRDGGKKPGKLLSSQRPWNSSRWQTRNEFAI